MDKTEIHPEFASLIDSWELALLADGFAANSVRTYRRAATAFGRWMMADYPADGPADVERDQVREWIVHLRETQSANTARLYFTGLKAFMHWLREEEEIDGDPIAGLRTPKGEVPRTPVLTLDDVNRLLATCDGRGLVPRRNRAILLILLDCGLRLAEVVGLSLDDVDLRSRLIYVKGKGSRRAGPRHRVVPMGIRTAQALDRYLRERRKHVWSNVEDALWLGGKGGRAMTPSGVKMLVQRHGEMAGVKGLHPHLLRHTWAHEFRKAGGGEGDLMTLGGWRGRQQLDRYGASVAAERAHEAGRRFSLGDRL